MISGLSAAAEFTLYSKVVWNEGIPVIGAAIAFLCGVALSLMMAGFGYIIKKVSLKVGALTSKRFIDWARRRSHRYVKKRNYANLDEVVNTMENTFTSLFSTDYASSINGWARGSVRSILYSTADTLELIGRNRDQEVQPGFKDYADAVREFADTFDVE